ncbi:MAG: ABC transporter ATP-binding protein, partial [Candidatus Acidiferrales bacterium]
MTFSSEVRRLLGYVRPHLARFLAGVFSLAILGVAEGLIALMIWPVVDVVLKPESSSQLLPLIRLPSGRIIYLNSFFPHSIHHVWTIFSISLLVIFVGKAIAEFLGSTAIQYVGHAGVTDLRNRVYSKLVQQPIGFFQHNPAGRLMSAVINDVEQVRSAFSEFLADFFRQIFSLIAFTLVLLMLNWKLALGSAIFIPLIIVPVGKLGRRIRRSTEKSRSRLADLSHILQETITGNRVVKAFGMERFEIGRFREAAAHLLRENMRWVRAYVATSPIMDVLGAIVFSLLILYARDQIKHAYMTEGVFIAFIYSMFKVYEPVKRLGGIYQLFQQAFGASTVVFQFLDLPEEVSEAPGAAALPAFSREVKFENLNFAYDGGGPTILHDINLTIPAGRVMAIVGSS